MRNYPNYPKLGENDPEFNQYLRENNKVKWEGNYWILIYNSYIEGQMVVFHKTIGIEFIDEISAEEFLELQSILKYYSFRKIYINATDDKSVSGRLHIHIA